MISRQGRALASTIHSGQWFGTLGSFRHLHSLARWLLDDSKNMGANYEPRFLYGEC
jgi:hypothetical protein